MTIGLRGHTAYKLEAITFDLIPGIYFAMPFNTSEYFSAKPGGGAGLDARMFMSPHFGIVFNAGRGFQKESNFSFGLGLVFKK